MIEYRPSVSVTAVRFFSMSTSLAASTVTPGSTAPDVSFTRPAIVLCADAVPGRTASRRIAPTILTASFTLIGHLSRHQNEQLPDERATLPTLRAGRCSVNNDRERPSDSPLPSQLITRAADSLVGLLNTFSG